MQGKKTHEQQLRILEHKPDVPDARQVEASLASGDGATPTLKTPGARQSEFPVSAGGLDQESDHNKHNDAGQEGHKPQEHSPAEEKK